MNQDPAEREEYVPKTAGVAVNLPVQEGSSAGAGLFMFLAFAGGMAAFAGGLIKINDETGGPTKHTPLSATQVEKISANNPTN